MDLNSHVLDVSLLQTESISYVGTFSINAHKGFAVCFLFKYPSTELHGCCIVWTTGHRAVLYLCWVLIMHLIHILQIELSVDNYFDHF